MPIRPLDIMKSQEATQYKHFESQRAINAQVHSSKNLENMIQAENKKTTKSAKSDNNEFRYDAKEKGSNGYNYNPQDKKNKKDNEKKKESIAPRKTGGIDILI